MANGIFNPKENYNELDHILSVDYEEMEGDDFYSYIFPNNENAGEMNEDFSKPNAVYLYKDVKDDDSERELRRRIILKDTWSDDYAEFVADNPMTLCSGLAYRGRSNRLVKAQQMNALVFDLDSVGKDELLNLFVRIGREPSLRTLPQPTFIVLSGTGLHIYYVLEEPIALYPNIKLQMKSLKYDLTFRLWHYKGTTKEKQIQYQSINQGFRMVGSKNVKYDLKVKAFKTGDKVSLETLNRYVDDEKNQVDLNQPFRPTKYTKKEAQEQFPEWYEKVVVQGEKGAKKWKIKRDLYDWWLRQSPKVVGGHRYYFLMAMAIYAVKCNIPKKELEKDMNEKFDELKVIEHNHPLDRKDIKSALETYDRQYYNFTIDDIVKLTDIPIQKNKRNYQKQKYHLEEARAVRDLRMKRQNKTWINLEGRPTKEILVKNFIKQNPNATPTEIARELEISRSTVYKYLK